MYTRIASPSLLTRLYLLLRIFVSIDFTPFLECFYYEAVLKFCQFAL
jgi:hypothetical protein